MAVSILSAGVSTAGSEPQANTARDFVKLVSEGIDLINKFSDNLSQNARSLAVEIQNYTSYSLEKGGDHFDHGGFTAVFPPQQIDPFQVIAFGVSSNGLATGVNGSIDFVVEGGGLIRFGYDNPFVGTNGRYVMPDPLADSKVAVPSVISVGNDAHVRFSIYDKLGKGARRQEQWRSCHKCQQLFYDGHDFKGVCPAGGAHDSAASFKYFAIFNANGSSKLQNDWRSCRKCQTLHYGAIPGACAAGGPHNSEQSFEYGVLFNAHPTPSRQLGWCSCNKCRALFYAPHGGRCAAGGRHDTYASFQYLLDFKV